MKTKTKPNSRHAQPTLDVLAPRIDKKLNKISAHLLTLAKHTNRLTDEKIILHGQVESLTEAFKRTEARWKGENMALRTENAELRKTQCKCPPTAANAYIAEPLKAVEANADTDVPTLIPESSADPAPPAFADHFYGPSTHCLRCKQLKAAIEASNLPCVQGAAA